MKKVSSIICAFFMGLFISIGIMACAEDDYTTSNSGATTSLDLRIEKLYCNMGGGDYSNVVFDYYDNGRISSIHTYGYWIQEEDGSVRQKEFTHEVTYNSSKIAMINLFGNDLEVTFNNYLDIYPAEVINDKIIEAITMQDTLIF